MVEVINSISTQTTLEQKEDFLIKLPEAIANSRDAPRCSSRRVSRENRSATHNSRKSTQKHKNSNPLPNLLNLSKLSKAVMKLAASNEDGTRQIPRYSSSGHSCWSSLRTREWQEFQRSMQPEEEEPGQAINKPTSAGFLYFNTPSRSLSTRGSKKPVRKQVSSDSGVYERARLADFKRIETVYSAIKQGRNQRWRDILEGVPSEYDSKVKPIKVKIIFDNDNILQKQRKARKLKRQEEWNYDSESRSPSAGRPARRRLSIKEWSAEVQANRDRSNSQERAQSGKHSTSRALCKSAGSSIPGPFVFPRASDFVPSDGTKVDKMGVDWKYAKCHPESINTIPASERAFSAPVPQQRKPPVHLPTPPKMHKASYNPVTEALRREGTNVAKIKGKVMTRDDMQVAKVWKRKLTNIIIPAAMAKMDIPESGLKVVKHRGKTDGQCDRSDEDEEDLSDIRQSISRSDSSCGEGEGSLAMNS